MKVGVAAAADGTPSTVGVGIYQVTPASQPSGSNFNYGITYSCTNTAASMCASGTTIVVPLGNASGFGCTLTNNTASTCTLVDDPNGGKDLVITLGDLDPGTSGTIALTLVPPNYTTLNNTTWTLTPTINYTDGGTGTAGSVTSSSSVTSTATAQLGIYRVAKTSDRSFYKPGDTVVWSVSVSCASFGGGELDAQTVTITDTIPANLSYVANSSVLVGAGAGVSAPQPTTNGRDLTWTYKGDQIPQSCLHNSKSNDLEVLQFKTALADPFPGVTATDAVTVTNTVGATVSPIDPTVPAATKSAVASITVSATGTPPDTITKNGTGPIEQPCNGQGTDGKGDAGSWNGEDQCWSETYPGPWTNSSFNGNNYDLASFARSGNVAATYSVTVYRPLTGTPLSITDPMPCKTGATSPNYPSLPVGSVCADPAYHPTFVSLRTPALNGSDTPTGIGASVVVQAVLTDGSTITLPRVFTSTDKTANGNPVGVTFRVPASAVGHVATIVVPANTGLSSRVTNLDIAGYVDAALTDGDITQNTASVQFYNADATTPVGTPKPTIVGHLYVVNRPTIGIHKTSTVNQSTKAISWPVYGTLTLPGLASQDLTVTDQLPADVSPNLDSSTAYLYFNSTRLRSLTPQVTIDPATGGKTLTYVIPKATLNAAMPADHPGGRFSVALTVDTTAAFAGSYTNSATISYPDPNLAPNCQAGSASTTTPITCTSTASEVIQPTAGSDAVKVTKSVKGSTQTGYVQYPGVGIVPPDGGSATFQLSWVNKSVVGVNQLVMYDILPHTGDTGTLQSDTSVRRNSTFTPTLTSISNADGQASGLGALPTGVSAFYSTSTNPCRDEVYPNSANTGCVNDWQQVTASTDLSTVKALKFTSTQTYAPGTGPSIYLGMTTPPISPGQVAWNTFATAQRDVVSGQLIPPVESAKVGISLAKLDLLSIDKTIDPSTPGPYLPGNVATYNLTITNDGNTTQTNVVATDTLPPGTVGAFVYPNGTGTLTPAYPDRPKTVTFAVGTLTPGQTKTYQVQVQLDLNAQTGTVLTNRLTATSDQRPTVFAGHQCSDDPNASCADVTIAPHPQWKVNKTVDKAAARPGDTLTYTLTYTNVGDATGTPMIQDYLNTGATYLDSDPAANNVQPFQIPLPPGGAFDSVLLQWFALRPLDPGQSGQITVTARINADQWAKTLTNAAGVYDSDSGYHGTADTPCSPEQLTNALGASEQTYVTHLIQVGETPTSAANQWDLRFGGLSCADTTTPALAPGLVVTKSASAPSNGVGFLVGEVVTYSFVVTNTGNVEIDNVSPTDTVFRNAAGAALTLAGPPTTADGSTSVDLGPAGAAGESPDPQGLASSATFTASYVVTAADVAAGDHLSNAATATGQVPDSTGYSGDDPTSTAPTVTVPLARPAISLRKVGSPAGNLKAGGTVTYTFTATNTGDVPLSGVTLTDGAFTNGAGDPVVLDGPPVVQSPAGFQGSLAVGASVVWTATYTVTQADVDAGGALTNAASVAGQTCSVGTDPVCVPVSDETSAKVTPTPAGPAVAVVKTASAPANGEAFVAGETVTYTLHVTNTGNVTLHGVDVTDKNVTDAAGKTHPLTSGPTPPAGFDGTLAPGVSADFTATYTVTAADVAAGASLSNAVTATGTPPTGPPVTGPGETTVPLVTPAISMVKIADRVSGLRAGDTVTYTFVATNTGNVTLHNVALAEDSFRNAAGDNLTLTTAPKVVTPTGFDRTLAQGATVTWAATYRVTAADVDAAGALVNTATASGVGPDTPGVDGQPPTPGQPVDDTSTATVTPQGDPAITLVKTAGRPANGAAFLAGDTVPYTLHVTNTGTVTLHGVTVTDKSVTTASGRAAKLTSGPTAPSGFDGTLAPGASVDYTASYTVTAADVADGTKLTNTATATGTPPGNGTDVTGDGSITVLLGKSAINLVKVGTPGGNLKAGQQVTYTFTATNTGTVPLTGVTLSEGAFRNGAGSSLKLDATPTLKSPSGFDGSLPVGASVVWTATYTVTQADMDAAGPLTNTATVTGSSCTPTPMPGLAKAAVTAADCPKVSDTSTAKVTPNPDGPAIQLVKTAAKPANGTAYTTGETVHYTFTVTNTGNQTLTKVAVRDTAFHTAAGADRKLTTGPTPPAGFNGTLAPGATVTYTGSYRVTPADAGGSLTNTAQATGTAAYGTTVHSNSTARVTVASTTPPTTTPPTTTPPTTTPPTTTPPTTTPPDTSDPTTPTDPTTTPPSGHINSGTGTLTDSGENNSWIWLGIALVLLAGTGTTIAAANRRRNRQNHTN